MNWHKDKAVFDKECAKYPGFVTKFCEKDPIHVDFENYRHVCHKWHYRLTKAFILCLDSGDYIQIRNSLIILTKLLPQFPVMISFAQAIERRVENIRNDEKEKRPDLFALATGYSGQLKARKSSFIPESEFHIKENKKTGPQTNSQNGSQKIEISNGIKKEIKTEPVVNSINEKESSKPKNVESKESNDKKKDVKKDNKSETKVRKSANEDKVNNSLEKNNRNESRSSSVSSLSPRRNDHRNKDDVYESDKGWQLKTKTVFVIEFL